MGVVAPVVGVVLSRMEAVLLLRFATAKSGLPSPLMSPMLTERGLLPVGKSTLVAKLGVVALVAVVLRKMEALSLPKFATAKSGLPSPLMSPMLTEKGLVPVVKSTLVAKVGVAAPVVVVLRKMETVLLPEFVTAKSGLPSPLMSPMLTDWGKVPVADADGLGESASCEVNIGGEGGGGGVGGGGVEQDGDAFADNVRRC